MAVVTCKVITAEVAYESVVRAFPYYCSCPGAMAETLAGKHILITSGPTRANLDAVRYISNRSTGRLGCRIAIEALRCGAQVTMVVGPESAVPAREDLSEDERARLRVLHVETVPDLIETLEAELTGAASIPSSTLSPSSSLSPRAEGGGAEGRPDAVLHAMAVLDYVPEVSKDEKTPSQQESWDIRLVRTPKVIRMIRDWAPDAYLVEFKLEVGKPEQELREVALASLHGNRADLVVANDLTQIRDETHPALIIAPDGAVVARPATKTEIASQLCDILAKALA